MRRATTNLVVQGRIYSAAASSSSMTAMKSA
jgi:hypothetical protein